MLNTEETNIVTLHLPERGKPSARGKYEDLKGSRLYDKKSDRWNYVEDELAVNSEQKTFDQLLSVFLEAQSNKGKAGQKLEALRPDFYDSERHFWRGDVNGSRIITSDQLMYILAESQIDKKKAQDEFNAFKKTNLYDPISDCWFEFEGQEWSKGKVIYFVSPSYKSEDQLLSVLIEAQLDKEKAREKLEWLKHSYLYDPSIDQFYESRNSEVGMRTLNRHTDDQLLYILLEAQFDKQSAREKLDRLKQTDFYDAEKGRWRGGWNNDRGEIEKIFYSCDQLLAILIEHVLEEPEVEESIPNLPKRRSY